LAEIVSLSNNPLEYGLPFTTWYPHQNELAEYAINLSEKKVLVVESPCGMGKSGIPLAVAHFRPGTMALMGTRDLQQQYADSFSNAVTVWGQEHYPCVNVEYQDDFRYLYGEMPTCGDCPHRKRKECDYFTRCSYELAKRDALVADAKILNYAYAYHTNWWKREPRQWDLFCDEAHRVPEILSQLISINVGDRLQAKFDLPPLWVVKGGLRKHLNETASWLQHATLALHRHCSSDDVRHAHQAQQLKARYEELAETLTLAEPESWYVESDGEKLSVRPVVPGEYSRRLINDIPRSVILMSATIGNAKVLLDDLGLGNREYEFVSMPHAFPVENRPVIWLKQAPRIRYRTTDKEYRKQADMLANLMRVHKGEKGLIHTASWHHTYELAKMLNARGYASRVMVADGARLETVDAFKNSTNGTVAISPSWQEGLNFPDDQLRWCVIAKVPFLSQGDAIVRMRIHRPGGSDWYKWKAALRVVQAAGRGVRHAGDWCITYVADGVFPQIVPYLPDWFEWSSL
jgi:Rad3-related DNA helicase